MAEFDFTEEHIVWINLKDQYTVDIADKDFGEQWWCWNLDLCVDFDFKEYPEILDKMHDIVRKHVPEDEIGYCEKAWENGEPNILVDSIGWYPGELRTVQDFLDELMALAEPIRAVI